MLITYLPAAVKSNVRANPPTERQAGWSPRRRLVEIIHDFKQLPVARTPRHVPTRLGFAQDLDAYYKMNQTMRGPPRSVAGFAPTCSIRRRQLAPR